MALIECLECSGQVSDKAEACPHCGAPVPQLRICLECDGRIPDGADSCPHCGAKIYNLDLIWAGPEKVRVVYALWKNTNLGPRPRNVKDVVDTAPCRLLAGLFPGDAFAYKELLEDSGAVVQLTQGTSTPLQSLNDFTVADLLEIAQQAGFETCPMMTKSELVELITKPRPQSLSMTEKIIAVSGLFAVASMLALAWWKWAPK